MHLCHKFATNNVWDAFENIYKNNFMSGTSYRSITAAQLLKDIRSNSHRTFEYYEIQDELEIVDIPLNYLSFKNCTFNEVVFISGNLGSGAVLNSCIIKKTITFRSIKAKFKRRGQIGLRSSLSIEKSEVKTLEIYDSELERGIQIINDSHIDNLIISGLKTSANSALKINDSTISSQFELTFFRTNGNIDIRTSEISCFARFEDIMASSFLLQQNKFKRLFVWGSSFSQGLSIDKTEFSDTLEFLGTSCDKFFGLYNSTFMKEFTVKNYDSNNSLTSHISHYFIQNSNFESGFHALNFKPDLHPDLTLYFSNSLKGNVIFESINFNKVKLQGHNNGLSLTFDTCNFISFQCNNVTNNQTLRLSNCESLKSDIESDFSITNSNLGKMNLLGCNLSNFNSVNIRSSFISEIQFANITWFKDYSLKETDDQNKETYRQLKLAAEKQGDSVSALNFKSKELFYYQKMLNQNLPSLPTISGKAKNLLNFLLWTPKRIFFYFKLFWRFACNLIDPSKTLSDRFILFLGSFTNNYGTNWTRPIFLILIITLVFHFAISISLSEEISWSFDLTNINQTISEINAHPSLYFHLLNPAHDLNRILSSKFFADPEITSVHWSVYAFDLLHRIIYAFLLFQLVVAFRKFAK